MRAILKPPLIVVQAPAPTFANVPYGPHPWPVIDFFRAEETGPAPVVHFIHGDDDGSGLQFLRSKGSEWRLDKARIGACSGSAGACSSLWIALHEEMAKPDSADPV